MISSSWRKRIQKRTLKWKHKRIGNENGFNSKKEHQQHSSRPHIFAKNIGMEQAGHEPLSSSYHPTALVAATIKKTTLPVSWSTEGSRHLYMPAQRETNRYTLGTAHHPRIDQLLHGYHHRPSWESSREMGNNQFLPAGCMALNLKYLPLKTFRCREEQRVANVYVMIIYSYTRFRYTQVCCWRTSIKRIPIK